MFSDHFVNFLKIYFDPFYVCFGPKVASPKIAIFS